MFSAVFCAAFSTKIDALGTPWAWIILANVFASP